MENVYLNLLNLYSRQSTMFKTPLEDFTTEIFASILAKDDQLLNSFMKDVLKIDGEQFKIKTQQKYDLEDEQDCIIDIVIYNESTICFLENKVNSHEGYRQLERYKRVLENLEGQRKVFLRYCTKYYDLKEISGVNFCQIRWRDVYLFLKDYNDSAIIWDFLDYMRRLGMAGAGNFNFDDMLVMNNVSETISKMDEVLDAMVPEFTEIFGEPYTYDYERLKEIPRHNRYTLWKDDIFPGGKRSTDSKVILGFEFYQAETEAYPLLFLSVVCNNRNSSYQKVKDAVHVDENFDYIDDDEGDSVWGWYEKPLSDFLPAENQLADIKEWFVSRIKELQTFKEKTEGLNWKV